MQHTEPFPNLNRALYNRDVIFLTDHIRKDFLFNGLRINVHNIISRSKTLKVLPESLSVTILLFWLGVTNSNAVFVTFGNQRYTYFLMLLQIISRMFIKPKPHILFDCLWETGDTPIRKLVVKLRAYLVNSVISKCIVYGKRDLDTFNKLLGISKEKLALLRYHTTVGESEFRDRISDGDYIFSGGTGRDYEKLLQICIELSYPLKIATHDTDIIRKAGSHSHIEVRTTTDEEFMEWMANSRLVVLPYGKQLLRTGGHQTFLNAMLMGKVVIVYQGIDDGYILDGINGVVIPDSDSDILRTRIVDYYTSKKKREELGRAAKEWVLTNKLTKQQWVYGLYDIAAAEYYKREEI
jgi:glycosyltransferase involved in cell wall biosynthesis